MKAGKVKVSCLLNKTNEQVISVRKKVFIYDDIKTKFSAILFLNYFTVKFRQEPSLFEPGLINDCYDLFEYRLFFF